MPVPSDSELVAGFGLPMRTAVTAYMPDEIADEFCDAYRAYQRTRHDELIEGIDGVGETLSTLKQSGIKMAVVTSKKRPAAIRDLGCYNLVEYFDTIVFVRIVRCGYNNAGIRVALHRQICHGGRGNHTQRYHIAADGANTCNQRRFQHIRRDTGILSDRNFRSSLLLFCQNSCHSLSNPIRHIGSQSLPYNTANSVGTE